MYRPGVLSSIESLEQGALQGLLWLKSGDVDAPMSLVNCNNDTTNTTTEVAIDESTLTLHPKKKKKKINRKSTTAAEKKIRRTITPENLPQTFDDNDAPTTLHSEEDKDYINPIHTIIRKDIIEVFVDKSDKSTAGMVRSSFSSNVARFISSWFTPLYNTIHLTHIYFYSIYTTVHISYTFHHLTYIFLFHKPCNNI